MAPGGLSSTWAAVAPTLPAGFTLGAATSAYQIEGAADADGRTASIWDTFAGTPGNVLGGHTGAVACDHYRRYREDVALMAELGLTAYRFSVSWPRVQPGGRGPGNPDGLDFYRRLVDALLDNGIRPLPTLYHWDLPQELEDRGGWPARDTAARFADYALLVHDALGDRVRRWDTLNEPWCCAMLGYATGEHAPGRTDPTAALAAAHHLLLGHGLAARALTAGGAQVGLALNLHPVRPATADPADADAARRIDGLVNRMFLDPVLVGRYPDDVRADLRPINDFDHVRDGDLDVIAAPLHTLGVNYYDGYVVGAAPDGADDGRPSAWPGSAGVRFEHPAPAADWESAAGGLLDLLRRLARDYPPVRLCVTENGLALPDEPGPDGAVDDPRRVAFLEAHLRACATAAAEGVPVTGYLAWSLLDNFEWAWGYHRRFGLIYVDYDAGRRRIPKSSATWYAELIRRHRSGRPETSREPDGHRAGLR